MDNFLLDAAIIFVLILLTGLFAMSEIAVISARRSRIKHLAEEGDDRARHVARLQSDPDRFFATIQIGFTVLQSVASALGGAVAVQYLKPALKPLLEQVPFPAVQHSAGAVALGLVVVAISYGTLILGELVPKSIGFKYSERLALSLGGPLDWIARILSPGVRFLTASMRLIMKLFGGGSTEGAFVSEEEIKFLIREGRERGIFEQSEQDLIHSVFEFTDKIVREVMVPRPKIHAIRADMPPDEVVRTVVQSGYSRFPVYTRAVDDTHGILYYKDLLNRIETKKPIRLAEMLHPVHFVPENKKVSHLLKEMQKRRLGMSMVVNEYGNVVGLVTIEDLIEEIVGEIQDEYDIEERPVERLEDGSLLVDAALNLRELREAFFLPFEESPEYETLAGYVLHRIQRIPKGGDVIVEGNYRITVVDMEGKRIARVKIERLDGPAAPVPPESPRA